MELHCYTFCLGIYDVSLFHPIQFPSILLSLLARFTAHSSSSVWAHPSDALPPFWPPSFCPRACCATFHVTYLEYLRTTNAMGHVLLAFVCRQDAPSYESSGSFDRPGSAISLGIPMRLKDWIRGYSAMLLEQATQSKKPERLQPCRGAHTIRVASA